MNLSTTYMGFKLPHPLIPGASPLSGDLDMVRRLEDAGAPMIVMYSLFEEQLRGEQLATSRAIDLGEAVSAEADGFLPAHDTYTLGPEEYLKQIQRIKLAVRIPVIASLNGTTPGGWTQYARLIENAGADGLEINLYELAMDPSESGTEVERRELEIVRMIRGVVRIPMAVKLSPFYSGLAHFAAQLDAIGVDALVLFNRFYQPDINPDQLEVRRVNLSSPEELPLRLRWLAALSGRLNAGLAVTGGIHSARDAVKAVMAGAHGVQMVSALLRNGPDHITRVCDELARWMTEHEYQSIDQMRGSMSLHRCPDPRAYERANYMQMLASWDSH